MYRVLIYARPWNVDQLKDICKFAFPNSKIEFMSDFLGMGGVNLQERFYFYLNVYKDSIKYSEIGISKNDVKDIILRCRLLRNLNYSKAKKMLICMWQAINEIYKEFKPNIGIGYAVDSYVSDLFSLKLKKDKKQYLGLVQIFLNGYFRFSGPRGEYYQCYNPNKKEIDKVYNSILIKEEKPNFYINLKSKNSQSLLILKNILKNKLRYIFFNLKVFITKDKFNYHYMVNQELTRISRGINFNFTSDDWKIQLNDKNKNINAFIPLQYFPEATVDYWTPNIDYIDYYQTLDKIIKYAKSHNVKVFIKEHPSMSGKRPKNFYKKITKNLNVIMIPTYIDSRMIIKKTDFTIVWTGTAGFEAAIHGKPVIHLGKPYYHQGRWFYYLDNLRKFHVGLLWVKDMINQKINYKDQRDLIQFLLKGSLPGDFKIPKRTNFRWIYEKKSCYKIGYSIRRNLKNIKLIKSKKNRAFIN